MKQIFKTKVPVGVLFALLDKFCMEDSSNHSLVVDMNTYRKIMYHADDKQLFLDTILPHYHSSKQFYVTRKFTYNSFVNIIRQICKSNDVAFTNKLIYDHSDYTIVYYISKRAATSIIPPGPITTGVLVSIPVPVPVPVLVPVI